MADTFRVEVVAANRLVWEGDAVSLVARTTEGDIGILARHEPVIAPLVPCAAEVTSADGQREVFAVDGGFLSVTQTRTALISPFVQLAREVSQSDAEAELADAERALDAAEPGELEEAQQRVARASAQVKAAQHMR